MIRSMVNANVFLSSLENLRKKVNLKTKSLSSQLAKLPQIYSDFSIHFQLQFTFGHN